MSEQFFIEELPNGLTLLAQHMEGVSSAAMTIAVPAGSAYDGDESRGAAAVSTEWYLRGAADLDTRQLNDALDALGCQHNEAVGSEHIQFSSAQLGRNLPKVLEIYADIVRRPRLEDQTFEPCRDLTLQDLATLEDEPAKKCNILLAEKFYPDPLGRCAYGTAESLKAMSAELLRKHAQNYFTPKGAIISMTGNIDWDEVRRLVSENFGDWSSDAPQRPATTSSPDGITHIQKDSAQAHIALAHRSVPISHEQYYAARMAETVLSGGMGSRLFREVREKRGLVYHVSCRYQSLKDHAGMFTYAGTVPEKAQETFDVTVGEIRRLGEGVTDEELARAKVQLKSRLVMQGESTAARAGAITSDWHHLKRLRSLKELSDAIDAVTTTDVLNYLNDYPAADFTILVIGPEPVDTSAAE